MSKAVEIHGFCDERFVNVKKVVTENFAANLDVGASLAVTLEGKYVVDLWGGYADGAKTRAWNQDTIINVFSTTKVMCSICSLILVDRGMLDLDAPVAKYWPEFAQNGKEDLLVRHVLSHTAGLPAFAKQFSFDKLYDWEFCVNMLAGQKPWWKPGTKSGYHAITFGYLVGEIIRRITGKSIGTFFKEEVAQPLKADFFIGVPEKEDSRIAELIPPKLPFLMKLLTNRVFSKLLFWHPTMKVFSKPRISNISDFVKETTTRAWRNAEIPAANGHGNAHSIARIGAILACGGEL
ncbi:MAG: serine hydrolase domain-containing protein, partial [Candidatus Helarchaeota archaeon]